MIGDVDVPQLRAMQTALRHRGPDETHLRVVDGRCGLVIDRLAIMDVAHGHQPVNCGDVHVVCNGEIYNHEPLREDLLDTGAELASHADVEVIPHLYARHGEACVGMLDGMFAFVLYDAGQRTFLAARDRFGIKPLYYVYANRCWYFASEARALHAAGVDVSAIREVPPGYYLTDTGLHRYYRLDAHTRRVETDPETLFRVLDTAVRRHLMADPTVKIGGYLSGGIDSAAMFALAAPYRPDLVAFTIGGSDSSDVPAARAVARHLGIEHVVVPVTADQLWALLPDAVAALTTYNPMFVTEGLLQMLASREAARRGFKVMLCGEGADEIFGGYGVYRQLPRTHVHPALRRSVTEIGGTECLRLDRATMAYSIEARVPFLDPSVVEYAINHPVSALLHRCGDGTVIEKYPLRMALHGWLPEEILWRPKVSYDLGALGKELLTAVLARMAAQVDDAALLDAQLAWPDARLDSKEAVFLHRLFRARFGDMGGMNVFSLFGDYPTLREALRTRLVNGGSTGETADDLARLDAGTTVLAAGVGG